MEENVYPGVVFVFRVDVLEECVDDLLVRLNWGGVGAHDVEVDPLEILEAKVDVLLDHGFCLAGDAYEEVGFLEVAGYFFRGRVGHALFEDVFPKVLVEGLDAYAELQFYGAEEIS